MKPRTIILAASLLANGCAIAPSQDAQTAPALEALSYHVGGRADCSAADDGAMHCTRQWPGTYFETAFEGPAISFQVGPGDVSFRISVDGQVRDYLRKPMPGAYPIEGLSRGAHRVRLDVVSESQAGPTEFDGFFAPRGERALSLAPRARQIEFIGDSGTVGYGITSPTRDCTEAQVWDATDTSQGFGALIADRFNADYQVNAISGRGVVRNYGGFQGDTLPAAYPYVLFDQAKRYEDPHWRPAVVVIELGANDFSTPLHDGEAWADRNALHQDFEDSYVAFLDALRRQYPDALIVVVSADAEGGEIETEIARVVDRMKQAGETHLAYVPFRGLVRTACNWHPSLSDNRLIAGRIAEAIEAAGGP